MLRRLAMVAWWLGLLLLALAAWNWYQVHEVDERCDKLRALRADIVRAESDGGLVRGASPSPPLSDAEIVQRVKQAFIDPRDTPELRESVRKCDDEPGDRGIAPFLGIVGGLFWAAAFVFGGWSFGRPTN